MERTTILKTPRLRLTTWSQVDTDELHRLHSDPETMRYIRNGHPESRAECDDLLAQYLFDQAQGWAKWRLTDITGSMIGRAGFGLHLGARELSYTIQRDRWAKDWRRRWDAPSSAGIATTQRNNKSRCGPMPRSRTPPVPGS